MPDRRRLRILLVEDDAISRRYLADALQQAGHDPLTCPDMRSALAASALQAFDLVLSDLALPDGGGERLFAWLRGDPASPNNATPFVALTAELLPDTRSRLQGLGFAGAVEKPVSIGSLERVLDHAQPGVEENAAVVRWEAAAHGPAGSGVESPMLPDLDDAAGVAVTGSSEVLTGLRRLFRAELPLQLDLVARAVAANDRQALHGVLHRLTASCGFCGAAALGEAVRGLRHALARPDPIPDAPVAALRDAAARCLGKLPS